LKAGNTDVERDRAARRGRALLEAGNFVAALDVAREALEAWPDDAALLHTAILALASCGSTTAALAMFQASALARSDDEDHAALEARLLKDLAWRSGPERAGEWLLKAAERYHEIHQRTKGTYSAVNAASLFALAGEEHAALRVAKQILPVLQDMDVGGLSTLRRYFHWATLAETAVVLIDTELFSRAMARAEELERGNLWARARTYTQLAKLANVRPTMRRAIEQWHRPQVAVLVTGEPPDWARRVPRAQAPRVEPALVFCAGPQGISPSVLERLSNLGASIHMLVERMDDAAMKVQSLVTTRGNVALDISALHLDPSLGSKHDRYRTCELAALGMSISRALDVGAPWSCLSASGEEIGPIGVFERAELEEVLRAGSCAPPDDTVARADGASTRPVAVLFADMVGYSGFSASEVQQYWSLLMPKVAAVLRRHASNVLLKKTWGDALHAIVTDATSAAHIGAGLVEVAKEAWSAQPAGTMPTFRISLHFGLVGHGIDPVEDSPTFFGPQLSLAARVEVVAPPGGIYVTEPFAARLTLEGSTDFSCSYVGTVKLPKGYGEFRLLSLQPRAI
jgi:class 3 adenylate cyclase/tetratricopeptide (TPR) repeat protein